MVVMTVTDDETIRGTDMPNARDVLQAVEAKSWRNAQPMWRILLVGISAPLLVFAAAVAMSIYFELSPTLRSFVVGTPGLSLLLAFVMGLVVFPIMSFGSRPFLYRKVSRLVAERLQPTAFSATGDALDLYDGIVRRSYKWAAFDDATRYKDLIILWRHDEFIYCAPVRSFASEAEALRFFEVVKKRIADAQPVNGTSGGFIPA